MSNPQVFADLALAQRLEGAEGHGNAMFVDARRRLDPRGRYERRRFGRVHAMFDGVDSPITQTFGLGLDGAPAPERLDQLEQFFRELGAPVFHEVSPLADPATLDELVTREYRPIEYSSVLYRTLTTGSQPPGGDARFEVRPIRPDEGELWANITVRGWSHHPELANYLSGLAAVSTRREDAVSFLVFKAGEPIAAGAMSIHEGVLLLGGACTVPEARRQGAQAALLDRRIAYALDAGCELAMVCAQPGSASQRNAERLGFRIAYTRIKWRGPSAAPA